MDSVALFALAIQHGHLVAVIAVASDGFGRHKSFECRDIRGAQLEARGGQGLGKLAPFAGANQGHDVRTLGKDVGDGELGGGGAFGRSQGGDAFDELLVA